MGSSDIFHTLQPLCVSIAQKPSCQKILELNNYIVSCNSSSTNLTALLEYIIFSLQLTIKRKNININVKLQAVNCICTLLSGTVLDRLDIFRELFQNVCLILSGNEPGKVKGIAEDAKEGLLDCILALLKSSTQDVLQGMYTNSFMPSLGHCISLLLCIAENEKAKHLIVKAIKCIENFAVVSVQQQDETIEHFQQRQKVISEHLASFLPGISISLSKVIFGGVTQGQNVIIGAINAWMSHIKVVLNDKYLPKINSVNSVDDVVNLMCKLTTENKNEEQVETKVEQTSARKMLLVQKDKKWYSNTSSKLKILIERLPTLAGNPNWKVHYAILEFSEVLLKNCSRSLEKCLPCLVEIVVGFSSNVYSQVSGKSLSIMDELQVLLAGGDHTSFIQIIQESLYTYFTSIPREIRSTEEQNKLHILHVILGYFHLLGSHLTTIINSGHFLKRISQALIQVTEFDLSDIKIVEQKTPHATTLLNDIYSESTSKEDYGKQLGSSSSIYKKSFKYFRDEKVFDAVCQICHSLGSSGQLILLINHFLEIFRSSSASRKQVSFLINEIIRGTNNCDGSGCKKYSKETIDGLLTCITLILNEYLSPDVWKVKISNEEHRLVSSSQKQNMFFLKEIRSTRLVSFFELNNNIQLTCLLLEGVSIFALVLQEKFDDMLLDVLYPLMEKLGSSNATVSQMANFCLVTIAVNCKYSSVEDLIKKNVDYLINSISLNLRHIVLHPETPSVFSTMLQCGNKELIPYLPDCLEEVLDRIDYAPGEILLSLTKALNSVVAAIIRWFPEIKPMNELKDPERGSENSKVELKEFFITYLKMKETSLGQASSDEELEPDKKVTEDEVNPEEEKPDKKEVPQHIQFTEQVLEKCTHFLTSNFVEIRLVMLNTTEQGVLALASEQDHLLPMIHKLWLPMVQCFSDDELIVRTRAVSVLGTMVNNTDQFMRRRVIKDTLPILTSFLGKQRTVSVKATPVYHHTQGFKLQLVILRTIGSLCHNLDISDVELDNVVSSVLPYLDQRQPLELQQAAVEGVKQLIKLDPDLIWLYLNDLFCPEIPLPPPLVDVTFPEVHFACGNSVMNQYASNVTPLLEYYRD